MSVDGAAWSGRAERLLYTFIEAACRSDELRRLLKSDARGALRKWRWECNCVPDILPVPSTAVSVSLDDETLLGPQVWREIEPDKQWLQQTQMRLLLAGAKPLALIHGDERSLTSLANWARARGYFTLLGPHEFQPRLDADKGGYSNRMAEAATAQAGSGTWRGLLLAPDEQTVLMAWLCQLFGWEKLLGRLLGYPSCCCEAFEKRWPTALSEYEGDVGVMLLSESKQEVKQRILNLDWTANIFGRYFGWEIIQHFPCRWDCQATASMAQRFFSLMSAYWTDEAQETLRHLTSPLLVIPDHGYCLFPGGRLLCDARGTSLTYDPSLVQIIGMKGVLARVIASSSHLIANKKGNWTVADLDIAGHLLNPSPGPLPAKEISL